MPVPGHKSPAERRAERQAHVHRHDVIASMESRYPRQDGEGFWAWYRRVLGTINQDLRAEYGPVIDELIREKESEQE